PFEFVGGGLGLVGSWGMKKYCDGKEVFSEENAADTGRGYYNFTWWFYKSVTTSLANWATIPAC
ncbi:MAG: hypothetical protein KDD44_03830, partial [Bdellovibrionales bacterium]|nr:hypothetical protein [Bdellovibrionales bacterium]